MVLVTERKGWVVRLSKAAAKAKGKRLVGGEQGRQCRCALLVENHCILQGTCVDGRIVWARELAVRVEKAEEAEEVKVEVEEAAPRVQMQQCRRQMLELCEDEALRQHRAKILLLCLSHLQHLLRLCGAASLRQSSP